MPKRKKDSQVALSKPDNIDSDAYADTDTEMDKSESAGQTTTSKIPSLFRLSSRVASMKRRGSISFCHILLHEL